MKRYLLLLCALCAFAGCKKDLTYSYAFYVNGTSYKGYNYTATYNYDTAASLHEFAANFYINNATDTNYVQVSFSGNHYIVPGVYYTNTVNYGNTVCSFAYNKLHSYYGDGSGILEIIQVDTVGHTMRGNFQFKAKNGNNAADSVVVTNGAFAALKYTVL